MEVDETVPRGMKRKADEDSRNVQAPKRIKVEKGKEKVVPRS